MLDLSADNQDGFDDTDGQLYTSFLLFFFAKNAMAFMKLIINNTLKGGNQMAVLAIVCIAIVAICYVSTHQNEGK